MVKPRVAASFFVFASLLILLSLTILPSPGRAGVLATAAPPSVVVRQDSPGTHFKGAIAASRFEMILWREGQNLRGNYYYVKSGSANSLDLRGKISESGEFTMDEFDQSGKQTGEFTGTWKDDQNQSGIELEGQWRKPAASTGTTFTASEQLINFTDSTKLSTITVGETLKARRLEVSGQYPELIGGGANTAGFNQIAKAKVTRETADFKKQMMGLTAADLKTLPPEMNNYLDISFDVEYADNDLISISFLESNFSGGAHPNYNYSTLNYDLKNGRELKLADLFKSGAKYLQTLSAYSLKDLQSRTDGGENQGLAQDMWEEGAKPTAANFKSWNLTRKGLLITFDPYQVGSYAEGPQFVIVPYAELKSIAKADGALAKMQK